MGYYTYVSGDISFTPPLTEEEIEVIEAAMEQEQIFGMTVELDKIVPYDDEFKAHNFEEDLQLVVNMLPGREFFGFMEGQGEDNDDVWRVRIEDGTVQKQKAVMTWPEEW